ncbi:TonB-dependent receptor [Pseudoduganella umbonata]|uniref:Outer membrane receptor protein involved in Fe transport n=1 Tax=Pseudoduganella umbonata TaxID=864828 RepID=A0A4P8HQ34_9BURK|nr:TonB-dependent receptor [Pseudoduganella umbonata]MBB3220647.1 outer membrane receptor protein involved in Fe transport [Pseudoduganella umbonata]QCP11863.1 TonB-dependent receptor [Pseudoduganella umbonata]
MLRTVFVAGSLLAAASCAASDPGMAVVQVTGQRETATDAASAGSVGAAEIAARPLLRTGELLEFVPGLAVTQHSGDGKANQYFLRGFNLDHGTDFATFVDGMPVNMRSHAHGQGYSDLNFVIPELVRRIDYRKGPYAAGDGDFASAGSARMVLADAVPDTASITAGPHGYRRALLAGTRDGLLYGLDIQRNDGPWTVPEDVRRMSGVLRWSGGDRDDGWHMTAMAYRNRWQATDQIPLRAVAQLGRFGSLDASDGGRASRYSVSAGRHGPWSGGRVELNAWAVRSSLDLYSNFTYALDRPEDGDQFRQSERRMMLGADAQYAWRGTLAGLELDNRAGVQVRSDRLSPVGLYTTVMRRTTATVREDRVRETSAGVFAESSVQWLPWLRTVAGARGDAYRFDVDGRRAGATIATPKLAVIAGPWRKTELFFNAGHGFHSNDARGVVDGVTPLVRTRGVEAGLRSELAPGLETSLTAWRLASGSELVFVGDAGTTEPSRASRRHGVEWNTQLVRGPWRIDLDMAVSRARYTQTAEEGDQVPGALERMAALDVSHAPAGGRWSAGFNVRHLGPRALVEDGSVRSRASTLAAARIGFRFGERTRLTLDVFNLLDRRASDIEYYYASRLPGEARAGLPARDDVHFHPVEPRTARLTLSHAF